MSWNGHTVIDMDAHIRERADRFYLDYLDPAYRGPYQRLCEAVARQEKKGDRYALFGSRTAIVEQLETGRALGVRDTFGLTGRSEMEHGRVAFPPGRRDPLPPIRQEVNWDIKARIEDMDRASVDIGVLFPTHVSSYCALRDGGFENALYRAYHRWVADFCAQAPNRLKWTVVANMRDTAAGVAEIKYWAERDPNLVGVRVGGCSTIPTCTRSMMPRRASTCRSSPMAARHGHPMAPAPLISTAPGSCCTPSAIPGRGWRHSVP
jgi:hypothetical protein